MPLWGTPSSWIDDDGAAPMTFGIGVGRYWSARFRTDITVDWVREQKVTAQGTLTYNDGVADVTVGTDDETKKETGVFLLNAYYDFATAQERRFKPYIGAGLGFALNILDRHSESSTAVGYWAADNKSTTITLAAAATLGFTYDLGNSMLLDMNYRFLHVGGSDIYVNAPYGRSIMTLDDQNEHQLRAGVRVDIE